MQSTIIPLSSFTDEKINEMMTKLIMEKMRRGNTVDDDFKKLLIIKMDAVEQRLANMESLLKTTKSVSTASPKNTYGETPEEKAQRRPITCPCCGKVTKPNNPKQEKCWTCLNADK